jgi:hypothetical protein
VRWAGRRPAARHGHSELGCASDAGGGRAGADWWGGLCWRRRSEAIGGGVELGGEVGAVLAVSRTGGGRCRWRWRCELVGAWGLAGLGARRGQRRGERGLDRIEALVEQVGPMLGGGGRGGEQEGAGGVMRQRAMLSGSYLSRGGDRCGVLRRRWQITASGARSRATRSWASRGSMRKDGPALAGLRSGFSRFGLFREIST